MEMKEKMISENVKPTATAVVAAMRSQVRIIGDAFSKEDMVSIFAKIKRQRGASLALGMNVLYIRYGISSDPLRLLSDQQPLLAISELADRLGYSPRVIQKAESSAAVAVLNELWLLRKERTPEWAEAYKKNLRILMGSVKR
jgi:hypothetical protein